MNQERFNALFLILFGIGAVGFSIWLMFGWAQAYGAALDYSSVVLRASSSDSTLPTFQGSPPIGDGLLGILAPVFLAVIGTGLFSLGIHELDKAP